MKLLFIYLNILGNAHENRLLLLLRIFFLVALNFEMQIKIVHYHISISTILFIVHSIIIIWYLNIITATMRYTSICNIG